MLFDTHAHYDDNKFEDDRESVIKNAHASGVQYMINAACNMTSAKESLMLSQKFEFIYAAVGIHPHNVGEADDNSLQEISDLAEDPKVIAIGEIGLDYYYDFNPKELQKHWLSKQINLARSLKLPIIIHNRDAHEDVMNMIKDESAKEVGGVFHCYSGSVEMAKQLLDLNFYISVGGPVTFKNAKKIIDVVNFVPMDRLLIETDSPYLTPEPFRGKRNDSSYVRYVAERIAEIKGVTFDEIAAITTKNAKTLFNIK